ncbi:MAG: hypothetical protein WCR66_02650 [Bacteroidota bacterium]
MDFNQLSYNDHTLFHMLRHFEFVNEQARICLKNRGYSMEIIDENIAMPGSKFNKSFATDIKSLVEQLKLGKTIQIQGRKKYQEIIFDFNQTEFTNGIGTLGVCNINELNALNTSEPKLKMNRGIQLWHATISKMPTINQLTLIVKKQSTSNFLITAFPGLPALPLPQKNMNPLDLELSKQYWADKVFLESEK